MLSNIKGQRTKLLKSFVKICIVVFAMIVPLALQYYGKTSATIFSLLCIIFIIIDKEFVDKVLNGINYYEE